MIVRAAHPSHYLWLMKRAGCAVTGAFRAIEAVDAQGEIRAMVGYDLWTATSVWMHVAIDSPVAGRSILRPAFEYPFLEAGRDIILATVRGSNLKARRLDEHLGFREVHRVKDGIAHGEDLIMFEMRKSECRWIKPARKAA